MPECFHADDPALKADVFPPGIARARLDRHPARYAVREHALAVRILLLVKRRRTWHRDQAYAPPTGCLRAHGFPCNADLGPRGDDDRFRLSIAVDQHVAATANHRYLRRAARLVGKRLAGQDHAGRTLAVEDGCAPGASGFNAITGPPNVHMGDEPQTPNV